jgi:hypothetical protein
MNAVVAVQEAFDVNIRTFVISVGNDVGVDHLRQLANVGQGFPADDPTDRFYVATAPATLAAALRTILGEVQTCTFVLDGDVDPDRAATASVTLDGTALGYGDPNGWQLNGTNQIELLGTACDLLKTGAHSVDIRFPCQ